MKTRLSICITISLLFMHTIVFAETVNLSAAASMTDAIKEIISVFSKKQPDIVIRPNFASSGSLAKQILQGAPADLYISANPKWMSYLIDNKMIAPETNHIFSFNKLVFISESISKDLSMAKLVSLKRIAIGSPKSVPAGKYAEQAMENAGIYKVLKEKKKLILAKDVRQALLYADRGEVDGAFVYQTDAKIAQNAKIAFVVPQDLYKRVSYPIALTVSGLKKPLAKAFYEFISSPDGAKILTKYGFEPNN